MKTNRDSKPHQPQAATTPSQTKDTNIDALKSMEAIQQMVDRLKPLIEFHKADEEMTKDDVRICWDVRTIRGKDTAFAHLQGNSTLHQALAPLMIEDALYKVEQEITDKIIVPMVGAFQDFVNRVALEELAAKEAVPAPDDLMDDDLR